jgi:hypothetical protein
MPKVAKPRKKGNRWEINFIGPDGLLQVNVPEGIPDHVMRTVSENARVLKFTIQGFE